MSKNMAPEPLRTARGEITPIDMEQISQNIQLLPADTLEKIAKGPLVKFTHTCDDIEKAKRVFTSLLQTFGSASISPNHTTAACNALSAFLDAAFVSKSQELQRLARSQETLFLVFDNFLTRFKDVKPRPMKQVLESLAVILAKSREAPENSGAKKAFVNAVLPSIILGEPRSRLKASIIALETLIRKNAIHALELISLVHDWLLRNPERWTIVLQEECRVSSIDIPRFLQRYSSKSASDLHHKEISVEILLLGLLNRTKAFELAASAGEVMTIFFRKLQQPAGSAAPPAEDEKSLTLVWVKPVKDFLLHNLEILDKLTHSILQRLFEVSIGGFRRFIDTLPLNGLLSGDMSSSSSAELTLLFASLQLAKKIGLVHEDHYFSKSPAGNAQDSNVLVLKSEFIGQFLFHHDFNIKLAALSLLIMAPSTTKPLSSDAIRAIIKSLPSLHAESDPGSRGEILSLVRGLIIRLKGGVLANKENPVQYKTANKKLVPIFERDDEETQACMKDYMAFLMADLRPTASYHRHSMALKTILLLLESCLDERYSGSVSNKPEHREIKWKFHLEIFGPRLERLLVDLLLDPFDEVRSTALHLLKLFPKPVLFGGAGRVTEKPGLLVALDKAGQLASNTSRADHADTVARLYSVIFYTADSREPSETSWWDTKLGVVETILKKLEDKLSSPEGLFNSALRDAPLHGYLCAIRYIVSAPNFYTLVSSEISPGVENWRSVHNRISAICDRVWDEVKPQLCIDSPEGHAAEDIEDLEVGPKDILSYSWRALRESSLLLHATLSNETYGPEGSSGLTRDDYAKIGKSSFTQLAELRHRGAFSTVAQTFSTCSQRCGQSSDPEISALPLIWYQEAKKIIFETASKLTRRSAGLPALIAGILLSNPGGPLFQKVVRELQDVAHLPAQLDVRSQTVELPQVHAMNCLREVYNNARLGPHTESYIMPALNLSAERMGSPIWALRNAGLMLFRALMNRMCRNDFQRFGGKSGSEPGARISFQKYPGLVRLLSSLLTAPENTEDAQQAESAIVTERVFPALELIAEKIPNASETEEDAMLLRLIREYLKSPVWGIREHAARVYSSLLTRTNILEDVRTLLDARDAETQNYLHGESVCVRYALRRFAFTPSAFWNEHIEKVNAAIKDIFAAIYPVARSPFVTTTLLEMLSDAVERSVESGAERNMIELMDHAFATYDILETLGFAFDSSNPSWSTLSTTRAFSLWRRQLAWITVLRILVRGETSELHTLLHNVATLDPNACQWLLERLHETFGTKESYRQILTALYSSIIVGELPLEAKTPAISNLALHLQCAIKSGSSLQTLNLPWQELTAQIKIGSTKKGFNRDRADADLQLEGCLLALKSVSRPQIPETEVLEWATRLRFALREETEFTTRYAAVTSIVAFAQAHRPSESQPRVDLGFLEIYLILYDLLNDDDEELRDIAAATASHILSYSSVSPSRAVILSPLNASELFATFLADNYADSRVLSTKAVRYILGQEPRIGDVSSGKGLTAVSTTVAELRKERTILFEEEKQNLFIEEVREADIWSGVLTRLRKDAFEKELLGEVFDWVSEGLACFSDVLGRQDGEDGMIGWLAKPEAYTLGVQLTSLAGVLVSREFEALDILGDRRAIIRERLQTLLERGKAALLHEDLVSRVQSALADS
ncbi:putative death-receptor fusion protein-domain-containing protein [Aspergillus pseudoustus]|uniref:Death-receptor fusion protein-domain-containing protein n=1 Tax=Aspergillus pseudoustus TaxID=1810923 RepID=A0ABR4J697_9EURO